MLAPHPKKIKNKNINLDLPLILLVNNIEVDNKTVNFLNLFEFIIFL